MFKPFQKEDGGGLLTAHGMRGNPVRMESARVLTVDTRRFACHVQPDGDDGIIRDVPLLFPMENPDGSGLYYLPHVGARVLLAYYDGSSPRILCGRNELDDLGYQGDKTTLREGDLILRSGLGYFLLRQSGLSEWRAGQGLRMALMPFSNTVQIVTENMDVALLGGRWQWRHHREDRANSKIPKGSAIYTQQFTEDVTVPFHLTETRGFHTDGALWRSRYASPLVSPLDPNPKQVVWSIGDLGKDAPRGSALGGLQADDDGDGTRMTLDIDDEAITKSWGEQEDGSVVRSRITGRDKTKRQWSIEETLGRFGDDPKTMWRHAFRVDEQAKLLMTLTDEGQLNLDLNKTAEGGVANLQVTPEGQLNLDLNKTADGSITDLQITPEGQLNFDLNKTADGSVSALQITPEGQLNLDLNKTSNGATAALQVSADGQVDLAINRTSNGATTTLRIDASGNITLDTEGTVAATVDGDTNVICDTIRLGSASSSEPVVLGDAWRTLYNTFIQAFNAHQHIGNMGGPTGPPITPASQMTDAQLSNASFTERK